MGNMYNSIPQGRVAPSQRRSNSIEENTSNPIPRQIPPPFRYEPVSREYADAIRSLAMTQINLGNKPKYCCVPTGYNSCK